MDTEFLVSNMKINLLCYLATYFKQDNNSQHLPMLWSDSSSLLPLSEDVPSSPPERSASEEVKQSKTWSHISQWLYKPNQLNIVLLLQLCWANI